MNKHARIQRENENHRIAQEQVNKLGKSIQTAIRDLEAEIDRAVREAGLKWPEHPILGDISAHDLIDCLIERNFQPSAMDQEGEAENFPKNVNTHIEWLQDAEDFLVQQRRNIYAEGISQKLLDHAGKFWANVKYESSGEPILSEKVNKVTC